MIKKAATMVIGLLLFYVGCSLALDLPEAKVAVKVIDENDKPVEGVKVLIGFLSRQGVDGRIKEVAEKGITTVDGLFTATKRTTEHIAFSADKEGYYKSNGEYYFKSHENGRWIPWNMTIPVVLRKIIDPVPMFARDTQMSPLPPLVSDKEVGFDLIEYDWVAPYGKGKSSDFRVKINMNYKNEEDYEYRLAITFPNKFDGIQLVKEDLKSGSHFKLPRRAPESGYQNRLVKYMKKIPNMPEEKNYEENVGYIFRIRSEERNGQLVRAMYGKIQGDIRFSIKNSNSASILFKYYLNPSYSTNLEYDVNKNLFSNLKSYERVRLY